MAQTWWGDAVQWTIWGLLMALVMGWLARSRFRPRPPSEGRHLQHPPSTFIVGLIGVALFGGMAVLSQIFDDGTATWWTNAIFGGFTLLAIYMIAEYVRSHHQVSEEGVSYARLTGSRSYLRWTDLRSVTYAPVMKWFRLETRSGEVARISIMLMGLPEFARLLLDHTPSHVIDADTLAVLHATASGNPPPLWE